jgi:hypothetical protein
MDTTAGIAALAADEKAFDSSLAACAWPCAHPRDGMQRSPITKIETSPLLLTRHPPAFRSVMIHLPLTFFPIVIYEPKDL